MPNVQFIYYLGDNELRITASIEGDAVEVEECYLVDDAAGTETRFDLDGVYVQHWNQKDHHPILREIEEKAIECLSDLSSYEVAA